MSYRQPFKGDYPITQDFGKTEWSAFHTGIDYGCPVGTPILASSDGYVFYAGWKNGGYGYCVFIKHPDGNMTLYEHMLSPLSVALGQKVEQSQVIGYSGSTGNSTGPHLHFEAQDKDGKPFDPMKLPLMSFADYDPTENSKKLKEADELGESVQIVAPAGAWAWSPNFDRRQTVFPCGTKLTYTGKTKKRNEYTYCECYPEPPKYWVAVHDNDCQILDNDQDTK